MAKPRIFDDGFGTKIYRFSSRQRYTPADIPPELHEGPRTLRDLEASWRRHLPKPSPRAHPFSLRRRAYDLLFVMGRLLEAIDRDPSREGDIWLAIQLGQWIADARARFGVMGTLAHSGLSRRRGSQEGGRRSGKSRRDKHAPAIVTEARMIRTGQPYDREHSTRWLAKQVRRRLKLPLTESSIRRILTAAGLR